MQLEIKFKSIAVRWFFNMFLIVVLIVCAVVIGFIAVVNSLYTEKIAMYAADITYEFNSLSETTPATFRDTAIDMAENFGFKDKLEVQVIDRDDNVVVTTTGFQPSDSKMADYEQAKLTGSAVADSTEAYVLSPSVSSDGSGASPSPSIDRAFLRPASDSPPDSPQR